ncbi:RraA family protein [Candidatus Symbiopectobacterium sp. NZEC127]|uniref:RraA family protein n=1 Tax=Candidatus Symbiopectobacterium sp. NZEC127 TaxID=2820472 RepID=UPI002226FFA6|nr:RraA family protein [Candidatus Symbiopectobacterium sp. NZEC127]MCW2486244.1 RraA family protein [Candidatus Symbiopectobacterium sp. NZEC127]
MSETKSIAQQLQPYADRLLGTLNPQLIRHVEITRPAAEVIQGFLSLPDLTSVVADILDELGYDTAIPAQTLRPLTPGQRIVGPAVTARQSRARQLPGFTLSAGNAPQGGGIDQITLTQPGDVFVVDAAGSSDASSFGGILATAAKAKGLAGVVVDGAVRDSGSIVESGLKVWSRSVTPRTGKRRLELVAFNDVVNIGGVQVRPGDLILADNDGVIIVPSDVAQTVLDRALQAAEKESHLLKALEQGASARDAAGILPPGKW